MPKVFLEKLQIKRSQILAKKLLIFGGFKYKQM